MNSQNELVSNKDIITRILTIRSVQIIIDRDLAGMYNVETKVLNQAVKRNIKRFPESFRFQLSKDEKNELVTNCDRFTNLKHSSVLPYAFTEQGVAMLSAVLRSEVAVKVSIQIMNAFVDMRKFLLNNAQLFQRLDRVERWQLESEKKFEQVFKALESRGQTPEKGIFFDGQVFDSYRFVADLIRKAKTSVVLIDNFVDDTVLTLLAKRSKKVTATIFTKQISKQLTLDIKKHNAQYPVITIKILPFAHDRFLLIDESELYHIGASLKDLGKKWFAFSKMDDFAPDILRKIKENKWP